MIGRSGTRHVLQARQHTLVGTDHGHGQPGKLPKLAVALLDYVPQDLLAQPHIAVGDGHILIGIIQIEVAPLLQFIQGSGQAGGALSAIDHDKIQGFIGKVV